MEDAKKPAKAKAVRRPALNEEFVSELLVSVYREQLELGCKGDADFQIRRLTKELGSEEAAKKRQAYYSRMHESAIRSAIHLLKECGLMIEGACER